MGVGRRALVPRFGFRVSGFAFRVSRSEPLLPDRPTRQNALRKKIADKSLPRNQKLGARNRKLIPPMRRAMYPGSFDPVTNGHLDVIQRASSLFDELTIAVAFNEKKEQSTLFSIDERIELLQETCGHLKNLRVIRLPGLLVQVAKEQHMDAIVRGLRAISDFEFEFQMALMNRKMQPAIETIFMMPREEYTYISSRIVKEIARLGGNVEAFVPKCVAEALAKKFLG
jgi:pantetheine-phosphate adenylyltransferase